MIVEEAVKTSEVGLGGDAIPTLNSVKSHSLA